VTGTLVATWMGTGSLFGNAEFAVKNGVSALLLPVASAVGIVVLTFLAPRARSWSSGCSWRSRWCTATRVKPRSCCRKPCVGPWGGKNAVFWIGVMLPGFLLILGDANLHQRFLSARDPATARRSAIGMFFGVLAVDWMIIGLALLGGMLLAKPPAVPGEVIVDVAFQLVPADVGMLIAAAGFAVILSTADSYLLATATSTAGDFSDCLRQLRWQRMLVVVLGLTALGLAFTSDEFFDVALYAYTLYGASLTPAILLALLRPKTTPAVVIAGITAGLGAALLWKLLLWQQILGAPWNELEPVIPALAANVLAMMTTSVWVARLTER